MTGMILASLPSPPRGVWHLGFSTIRAYALCIITGIAAAVLSTERRWQGWGGRREDVLDVSVWVAPFGLVGGRLYHVITDPEFYFTPGQHPIRALYVWTAAWDLGAVALGAVVMDRLPPPEHSIP